MPRAAGVLEERDGERPIVTGFVVAKVVIEPGEPIRVSPQLITDRLPATGEVRSRPRDGVGGP